MIGAAAGRSALNIEINNYGNTQNHIGRCNRWKNFTWEVYLCFKKGCLFRFEVKFYNIGYSYYSINLNP